MCIKMGDSELSSVKALMSVGLKAIIADTFEMELEELQLGLRLQEDMGMDAEKQDRLAELVAEYFNGQQLNFRQIKTVNDLFRHVVDQAFSEVSGRAS